MVEKTDDQNQITAKVVVTLIIVILVIFFVIWLVNKLRRNPKDLEIKKIN